MSSNRTIIVEAASPWKRIFAWVYDWLPAAGVAILTFVIGLAAINVMTPDIAADEVSVMLRNNPYWLAYLIVGTSIYYLYCWVKGGQTVGMRTWRIQLVKSDGSLLGWKDSMIRAFLSCGGLANLWSFLDEDYRGWHDIAVDAYVVQLPKMEKSAEEKKPLI